MQYTVGMIRHTHWDTRDTSTSNTPVILFQPENTHAFISKKSQGRKVADSVV